MSTDFILLASEGNENFDIQLRKRPDGSIILWRRSKRSGISNSIGQYTLIKADGEALTLAIDEETGLKIVTRICGGEQFSSCFFFTEDGVIVPEGFLDTLKKKSGMEEKFTSTGAKFWHHKESLLSYKEGTGRSIISTHISPEGKCNLSCPYCSVTHRTQRNELDMGIIEKYVNDLRGRGLKAVILTGGGEPTLYPQINELFTFLFGQGLRVALITNGTQLHRVDMAHLRRLAWMRVSVNLFEGWEEKIIVPALPESTTVGMSFIYTPHHMQSDFNLLNILHRVKKLADRAGAKYVRLLPNCLLDKDSLILEHMALSKLISELNDPRFFHQGKVHEAPDSDVCHQSYFRPYLSEESFPGEDAPGSVFPCDSVVLNKDAVHFSSRFAVCRPNEILDYLDGHIKAQFNPRKDCTGCVFTHTVNMLERFKSKGEECFTEASTMEVSHVEFV